MVTALILLWFATVTSAQQTFTVAKAPLADVLQESLQAMDSESKQATEVFPGAYDSPYPAAILARISTLVGRVDEFDRAALVEAKVGAGVDRSITAWRADPTGRTVVLAVRYHRDRLMQLDMKFSNDYGGPEPIDRADFESLTLARCSRAAGAGRWTCREELLAEAARRHNVRLTAAASIDATAKLLDLVLAEP